MTKAKILEVLHHLYERMDEEGYIGGPENELGQLITRLEAEAEKPLAVGQLVILCPNCHGQKTVQKPSLVAGDQPTWVGTGTPLYPCPTCDVKGYIILPAKEEADPCPDCGASLVKDRGFLWCPLCGYTNSPTPIIREEAADDGGH